jgi:hypothetical protein
MSSSLYLPASHLEVLRLIVERVPPDAIPWALTGSAGLRLQGVEVSVDDLDLQTDRQGVQEITSRFAEAVEKPMRYWHTDHMRSYFCALKIDDIRIEVMGEIQKRMPDGSWETPIEVDRIRCWVEVEQLLIPVVDLSHELIAYEILGRVQATERIRKVLSKRGNVAHG